MTYYQSYSVHTIHIVFKIIQEQDRGGFCLSHRGARGRPTGSQRVNGLAYRVPGGQGVGLQGPKGLWGRLTGSQGATGWPTGSQGSIGWPTGSQGVKRLAYRVPGSQGVSLHGPRGSRG